MTVSVASVFPDQAVGREQALPSPLALLVVAGLLGAACAVPLRRAVQDAARRGDVLPPQSGGAEVFVLHVGGWGRVEVKGVDQRQGVSEQDHHRRVGAGADADSRVHSSAERVPRDEPSVPRLRRRAERA